MNLTWVDPETPTEYALLDYCKFLKRQLERERPEVLRVGKPEIMDIQPQEFKRLWSTGVARLDCVYNRYKNGYDIELRSGQLKKGEFMMGRFVHEGHLIVASQSLRELDSMFKETMIHLAEAYKE